MKRIYLLIALVALLGVNNQTQAQNLDLEIYHRTISDTMRFGGPTGHIIRWGFINKGPMALNAATDTLLLRTAYTSGGSNRRRLSLPTAGIPAGDTVYFSDTVFFSSAPGSNPFNWCDTVRAYRNGSLMAETDTTNNVICKTIPFKSQVSVENVVADNSFNLFPNPATSKLTINFSLLNSVNDAKISIRNLVGQTVLEQPLSDNSKGKKQVDLNISKLNAGIYVAELEVNGQKTVAKFSVVK